MSDSESDSELNESIYDPEDNLNFYGSPVCVSQDTAPVDNAPVQDVLVDERTQFCSCKNTCSKGSGRKRRGCPCRDEGLKCSQHCACGTTKAECKNKPSVATGETSNPNTGRNAFERHAMAVTQAKQDITVFLETLTFEQKDHILVEILSNGKGSLDYAKNLVSFGVTPPTGDPPTQPEGRPPWCKCGVCQPMPNEEENKCCGKVRCTTSFVTFQNTCTDRDVLTMAIRARCDIRAEEPDYSTNSFRKAAYRQYILWRYKKLGRGNRRVCPSCVVLTIRHIYPADDGVYMGFRRA